MGKTIKELLLLHFLNDGVRTTFITLLPFIAKDLNISLSTVGFLGSSQPLLQSFLALPAGFLAAKFGGFKLLTFLLLIYSLGAFLTSFSSSHDLVVIAFLLGACGFGMFHTVGFSLVAKISEKETIGKNMGEFTSVGDIGRVVMPPIAVFLVTFFDWRLAMVALSAIGIVVYILLKIFQVKRDVYEVSNQVSETHGEFFRQVLNLTQSPKLLLTMSASILDALASSPVVVFLPFLLLAKGINTAEYGLIMGIYFGGSLAGKYLLGRSVDILGNAKVFLLAETLMAISLILLIFSSGLIAVLAISFLLGIFTKGTTPVIQTMVSEISHKDHYDKVYALSEMILGIAATVTVIGSGIVADKLGIYSVFYIAVIMAFGATIPVFFFPKSKI